MTPAKRGMLVVVERRHTSTALHGATTESVDYAPGIVASTRDGIALAYIDSSGVRIPLGTVTHPRWWVVSEIPKGRDVTGHIPTSPGISRRPTKISTPHAPRSGRSWGAPC